jgi:hypothetical protein
MARERPTGTGKKDKLIADQAVSLAEYAAKALAAAERLRTKTKAVEGFPPDAGERATAAEVPALAPKLKKRLARHGGSFTLAEVASMVMAAAESFVDAEPQQQVALLLVARKLMDCLQSNIVMPDLRRPKATTAKPDCREAEGAKPDAQMGCGP